MHRLRFRGVTPPVPQHTKRQAAGLQELEKCILAAGMAPEYLPAAQAVKVRDTSALGLSSTRAGPCGSKASGSAEVKTSCSVPEQDRGRGHWPWTGMLSPQGRARQHGMGGTKHWRQQEDSDGQCGGQRSLLWRQRWPAPGTGTTSSQGPLPACPRCGGQAVQMLSHSGFHPERGD